MIAGHFGFAALVKSREPQAPLWALMLATVWLDIVFVPLFLAGVEPIETVVGAQGGYGENVIHADYTHSLLGALALSAAFGVAFAWGWGRRVAVTLGLVAFSHWILDLPLHRGDMPWLPGNLGHLPKLGWGLWQYPGIAMTLELLLVVAGAWFYWRAARALTTPPQHGRPMAILVSSLILAGGIAVLALDVTGG